VPWSLLTTPVLISLQPDSGVIKFNGEDITRRKAAYRCKLGLARSFQVPQPFIGLTVFENALVGATQGAGMRTAAAHKQVLSVLEETELLSKANVRAGELTLLDRKRLELARALAAQPSLLLLDEIAGGLTDSECTALIATIKNVRHKGTTVVWIEHVVHALLAVVDKIIVLNFGSKIIEGDPDTVMNSDALKEIYLGVDPDV